MYYVYILLSKKDNKFYTGSTSDLKSRIEQHEEGKVPSMKDRRPLDLIYYEACFFREDAFRREKYLKTGMVKRYLRNRLKGSFEKL